MNGYKSLLYKMCLRLVTAVGFLKVQASLFFQLLPRQVIENLECSLVKLLDFCTVSNSFYVNSSLVVLLINGFQLDLYVIIMEK